LTESSGPVSSDLLCFNSTVAEICGYITGSKAIVGINTVTILVNILNMVVLSSVKKLRGTKYFWTLVNIGTSDIFASLMFILQVDCSLKLSILEHEEEISKILLVGIAIPYMMSLTLRNSVLALASYERYVAICTPFKYVTNKVVYHLAVGYIFIWVVSFVISAIMKSLAFGKYCVDDLVLTFPTLSTLTTAIQMIFLTIPAVVTIVTLGKVGVELKRMSRRAVQPAEDEELKKAGKYVLLTSILFYLSFFPTLAGIGARQLAKLPEEKAKLIDISAFIVQGSYGTLNVILFIYLNPSYIQQMRKLLKCKQTTAVTPQVGLN